MVEHDDVPLTEIGPVPKDAPRLSFLGSELDPFSLDWETDYGHEVIVNDEIVHAEEYSIAGQDLFLSLSAPETPLTMDVMVFDGRLESIAVDSEPLHTFDCLTANDQCSLDTDQEYLALTVSRQGLPDEFVVSIFMEYYKDPSIGTELGFTNIIGWVFGVTPL